MGVIGVQKVYPTLGTTKTFEHRTLSTNTGDLSGIAEHPTDRFTHMANDGAVAGKNCRLPEFIDSAYGEYRELI